MNRLLFAVLVATSANASAEPPRSPFKDYVTNAPKWTRDCEVMLMQDDAVGFELTLGCEGTETVIFKREKHDAKDWDRVIRDTTELDRATTTPFSMTTPKGKATGVAFVLADGTVRGVLARRPHDKQMIDVFECQLTEPRPDQLDRCRVMLEAFARSRLARDGRKAFGKLRR